MNTRLARSMPSVELYQQKLQALQAVWDSLSLLAHLSDVGAGMHTTREAFEALMTTLLQQLKAETLAKTTLEMKAKAQVAVDIMIRNLFERTADIGFLACDEAVAAYLRQAPALVKRAGQYGPDAVQARQQLDQCNQALLQRFQQYVDKYSVYGNVILLEPGGHVLLQHDNGKAAGSSRDPLIAATLAAHNTYVETFRRTDLQPGDAPALVYSQAVRCDTTGEALGVLCLVFSFADETERIFAQLRRTDDWHLLALTDATGTVVASSDACQVPPGARVQLAIGEQCAVTRFAGREYLALTRPAAGYQGYAGPGWFGHVMVPLQYAFEHDADELLADIAPALLEQVLANPAVFAPELRAIPQQAEQIQQTLNRSVWNGNVAQGKTAGGNGSFTRMLLREVSHTGQKTKQLFSTSIDDLYRTAVSSILGDSRFLASLAVDILDRNLYERANDCRWWALDPRLADALTPGAGDARQAGDILRHINTLYSVYHNLVLFDERGYVVAVSNPLYQDRVGRPVGESWATAGMQLEHAGAWHASPFEASGFYRNQPTYTFCAAIFRAGRCIGGIGVVFDSAPQFQAMLLDSMPRADNGAPLSGCLGLFVDAQQRVIAATGRFAVGEQLGWLGRLNPDTGEGTVNIVELDGLYYALGMRSGSGYREFPGLGISAVMMMPLGAVAAGARPRSTPSINLAQPQHPRSSETADIATFLIGTQQLGMRVNQVIEARPLREMVPIPGAPTCLVGHVMYDGLPIVVVDIAQFLNPPQSQQGSEVVIVRGGAGGEIFGLLVSGLADIQEIPLERLEPLSSMLAVDNILTDSLARPSGPQEPILVVLSAERIQARLRRHYDGINQSLRTPQAGASQPL